MRHLIAIQNYVFYKTLYKINIILTTLLRCYNNVTNLLSNNYIFFILLLRNFFILLTRVIYKVFLMYFSATNNEIFLSLVVAIFARLLRFLQDYCMNCLHLFFHDLITLFRNQWPTDYESVISNFLNFKVMKNFFLSFVFIFSLCFSFSAKAQTDFDIVKETPLARNSQQVNDFLQMSDFMNKHRDITVASNGIKSLDVRIGQNFLLLPVSGGGFESVIAINNGNKSFSYVFTQRAGSLLSLYNSEATKFLDLIIRDGKLIIQPIASVNSVFRDCMDAVEADFKETVAGYLYWEFTPAAITLAAIACQGCAKGFNGMCPPAYLESLKK